MSDMIFNASTVWHFLYCVHTIVLCTCSSALSDLHVCVVTFPCSISGPIIKVLLIKSRTSSEYREGRGSALNPHVWHFESNTLKRKKDKEIMYLSVCWCLLPGFITLGCQAPQHRHTLWHKRLLSAGSSAVSSQYEEGLDLSNGACVCVCVH